MKKTLTVVALLALVVVPTYARDVLAPTELVPTDTERATLAETFLDYRMFEVNLDQATEIARTSGQLSLDLGNRVINLDLEVNNLRSPGYKRFATLDDGETLIELEIPPVSQYKGHVVGFEESVVRLSIRENRFRGYVMFGNGESIWFDPADRYIDDARPGQVVAYLPQDVISDPDNAKCGFDEALHAPAALGLDVERIAPTGDARQGIREWEVATEADGEWEDRFGSQGGLDEITDIINDVDGIYISELDLTVNIAFQHIWTNPNTDPFVGNDAFNNLDDLESYWNFPPPGIRRNAPRRDMVHHFSGKNFNSGVVGIAYLDAVCRFQNTSSNFSFGISQDFGSNNQQVQLTAHEMGHNWGSNHLDQSPCNISCGGFGGSEQIMCSFIQSNPDLTFNDCTADQINSHVAQFGNLCLNP